jgi:TolA-binding protein
MILAVEAVAVVEKMREDNTYVETVMSFLARIEEMEFAVAAEKKKVDDLSQQLALSNTEVERLSRQVALKYT